MPEVHLPIKLEVHVANSFCIVTLQQFLQNVSDVPESVMKSVWETDAFIIGLAQKCTK
jgi:hypothetical protein